MHKDDIAKYNQWKAGGREVGRCNVVSTSWATPERRPGVTKTGPGQGRREGEGAPRWDYRTLQPLQRRLPGGAITPLFCVFRSV